MIKKIIKIILLICLVLIVLLVMAWWFFSPAPAPVSQAFINGTVLTMDANDTQAEAVLVRGKKIVFVGSTATVLAQTDDNSLVHDLKGRVLMPGIIDAHGHFPGDGIFAVAANLNPPPVGSVSSIADIQKRLRAQITGPNKSKRKGQWLFGFGFDDTVLGEGSLAKSIFPTREDLDAVSTDHPIFIAHVSGHFGVVNSAGLTELGITEQTPNPEGGEFVKDNKGRLTGLLKETASLIAMRVVTDFSLLDSYKILNSASQFYAAHGVTTAQNGATDPTLASSLRIASRVGLIPIRLQIWPTADTADADRVEELKRNQTELFTVGAVKLLIDGSIQAYTGYLSEPYYVVPKEEGADYRGHALIPKEKLIERVEKYHSRGIQMALHGNGDAAIDDILDAVELAQSKHPNSDPRHILIHAQMAREDQLVSMQILGVTPSFFSAHTYYWGDRHRDIFMGPERAARMSPAQSAESLGLPYTIHLDSPVVPMEPMRLVWSAVNRLSFAGNSIGPDQRISPLQALRATTIDAAWQIFKESEVGSIEAGKFADLIVLDQNPLLVPEKIDQIKVLKTYVGGREVFNRSE